MYYYKIAKDTELGRRLKEVSEEADKVCEQAERFAKSIGAVSYLISPEADFGGAIAFEFPKNKLVDKTCFDSIRVDGTTYYIPRVEIIESVLPSEEAVKFRKRKRCIVSESEFPYQLVAGKIPCEQAAKMAGVELTSQPIGLYRKKYGLSEMQIKNLGNGIPARMVAPELDEEACLSIDRSMDESRWIAERMSGSKFRIVREVSGTERAVSLYMQIHQLEVVPKGTVNRLLSVDNPEHRCGISCMGDMIYVTSAVEINNDLLTAVSEEEFWNGMSAFGNQSAKAEA